MENIKKCTMKWQKASWVLKEEKSNIYHYRLGGKLTRKAKVLLASIKSDRLNEYEKIKDTKSKTKSSKGILKRK